MVKIIIFLYEHHNTQLPDVGITLPKIKLGEVLCCGEIVFFFWDEIYPAFEKYYRFFHCANPESIIAAFFESSFQFEPPAQQRAT